jgi:hypothetical protein
LKAASTPSELAVSVAAGFFGAGLGAVVDGSCLVAGGFVRFVFVVRCRSVVVVVDEFVF